MAKRNVNLEVLEGFGPNSRLRKKWLKMWNYLGCKITRFPEYMQAIILEDVNTAIKNRVATMEMILEAEKRRQR